MLLNLYIKNFAIIKEVNIDFKKGLNIISGETGSGKSLLLKTLGLLKGERFSKDYLGIFDDITIVEAVCKSNDKVNNILKENSFDTEENIILTRQFTDSTSISKINNRVCNMKFLSQVSSLLFDIHGQHLSLIALDKSSYIDMIDKFNPKTSEIKNQLKDNLKEISSLEAQLRDLNMEPDEIEREKDLLSYQIREIEAFDFSNYDEESLNKEYKKLSNQKELIETTNQILDFLTENTRRSSFKDMAASLYASLNDLSKLDDDLEDLVSDSLNIRELISDLASKLESYSYSLDIDDERVQIIEDMFSDFQVLKMKYGQNSQEILDFLVKTRNRFDLINNIDKKRKELEDSIKSIKKENQSLADDLSILRKDIIEVLEKRIINELLEMNMDHIDFKISKEKSDHIGKYGQDEIDFLISTNKGQELKSLSQVSSGGEISRFMLAMKAAISEHDEISTLIFDEIDTGISGKTADIVGDKLKKISKSIQLLVISHLAQIASKSDNHYLLKKDLIDDYTVSNVVELNEENKVREIARLISGSDITEKSLMNARELLEENND